MAPKRVGQFVVGRKPRGGEAGFTLMELILTIILIGAIGGVAGMIILEGTEASIDQEIRTDLSNQGRLAMERMVREIRAIRQAADIGPIAGNPAASFSFTDPTGLAVSYSLAGTVLNRGVGGMSFPLADNVALLEFRHFDRAGALTTDPAAVWRIQIDLGLSLGGEYQAFRIQVHPRGVV